MKNKECLVLNFPCLILRIDTISYVIVFSEITRWNHRIHNKTLQFMLFDDMLNMLSPMEIVQIIELLGDGIRK